ncbi:MAG: carboxypeptidase-like regulatory domain-containing protein, partial [Candidatus Methanomethylicaceae archaeon]
EVIKNFTVRVLWYNNSAVVYEKVWNMTKEGLDFVKEGIYCEVYNITFVTAICKDVNRAVKNLNVTIWWRNATENPAITGDEVVYPKWWNGTAWITDPAEGKMPWKEGKWTFVMVPGPKYFNVSDNYYHVHVEHDAEEDTGVTELAYPGSMGTKLRDLYWDPVEKEWLPDAPYCIFSGKEFKVGIKLNATDIEASALTWRREEYRLVKYPVVGYVVEAEVTIPLDVTLKFKGLTGPDGKILFKSGDTIDKVIWAGSTIDHIVIKPSDDLQTPASDLWRSWMEANVGKANEKFVIKDFAKVLKPMEGAILELEDIPVEVADNDPDTGLHVPFKVHGNYTAVTVTVSDFNGRPIPGAFVELIELSSRKVSSWSYTDKNGQTVIMNVTAGWPEVAWNNYIIRVYFLGYAPNKAEGAIPIWPITTTKISIPVVYDTWEDEPMHKWITVYNELGWYISDVRDCGKHSDVIARVFDMRLSFFYEKSKPIELKSPDGYVVITPLNLAPEDLGLEKLETKDGSLLLQKLVRGTYKITAWWKGKIVATKTIDVSQVNVGTVYAEIPVEVYDLTLLVTSATGVPLSDAEVEVVGVGKVKAANGIASFPALPAGVYTVTATWSNYGKTVKVAEATSELARLKEAGKLVANVFDVALTLVDGKARPISGATIKLAGVPQTTDVNGKAIFTLVPAEVGGTVYDVSAEKEGKEIAKASITVSPTRTEFTIIGGLYDLRVQVVGAAGQGLPMATVVVKRAGVEVATLTTDPNGVAVVPQLVASDYDVEVLYKGFSGSASISASDLAAGKVVTISLPPYAEVFGIVLTYWTFLAIVIGLILLIIVLVVLLSEYITWRRRKLGIYLPPPPKKEEK